MRIGELAELSGVPAKTIRYWEDVGLVPAPQRTSSGYRDYEDSAVERLTFIRYAQAAAFTLGQIRTILQVRDRGEAPCEHVTQLVQQRLSEVEDRMRELRQTRRHLLELARRAEAVDPTDCRGVCEILPSGAGTLTP